MKFYKELEKIFKQLSHLHYTQRIMMWDEAVMMPIGAGAYRAAAMATLNKLAKNMLANKKIKNLIDAAKQEDDLSEWDVANLRWIEKKYLSAVCISSKLIEEYTHATLACGQAWRYLRPENDWRGFCPFLNKSFQLIKEIAIRKSEVLNLDPYDVLLDEYAPGFNQKNIEVIFSEIKTVIPDLKRQIIDRQQPEAIKLLLGSFQIEKQKALCYHIMNLFNFDFQHGRLDTSHHPFCDGVPEDVRITTRYDESNFLTSLMATCHETGHALYEQGMPRRWITQPVGNIQSKVMHESQSLLIEKEVCGSFEFLQYLIPHIQKIFGNQPAFTADNLYKMITRVQPSLIRIHADEVTYPLHIILRYEIEKKLVNGDILIQDLPECWNDLMIRYFDLSTKGNEKEGVMQDMHWPIGLFGYFPSYTLGRLIASQLFSAFLKAHPNFFDDVQKGQTHLLRNWLSEHIYSAASSLDTHELLVKVTGVPLSSSFFIERIKNRYLGSGKFG